MSLENVKMLMSVIRTSRAKKINRDMIGYTIEDELGPLNGDEMLRYAEATKDPNPLYSGPDPIAPPFFISKLIWKYFREIITRKDLGLNILKIVHGQQIIKWHGPLRPGDIVRLTAKISDVRDTPAGELVEISGIVSSGGKPAVEAIAGFVVRSGKSGNKTPKQPGPADPSCVMDINTDRGQNIIYAAASEDNNFIHTSNFFAKMSGLPGVILHGICTLAMTTSALAAKFAGGDVTKLRELEVRFSNPVLPGETLTVRCYETGKAEKIEFDVINGKGKTVLKNGSIVLGK